MGKSIDLLVNLPIHTITHPAIRYLHFRKALKGSVQNLQVALLHLKLAPHGQNML